MREDAMYKKKMMREAVLIQAYEGELRDSTEYDQYFEEGDVVL